MSSIIGEMVQFSTNRDTFNYGIVLGVENILHSDNQTVVTGYLIKDTTDNLHHVVYSRVMKVIKSQEEQVTSTNNYLEAMGLPKNEFNQKSLDDFEEDDLPF